ncbi:MAG: M23 family metallopeptidase [Pseudomonadota bacterium]
MSFLQSRMFGSVAAICLLVGCATEAPPPPPPAPSPSPTPIAAPEAEPEAEPETQPAAPVTISGPLTTLRLCPIMTVQNAPGAQDAVISNYTGFVTTNGVKLAVAPVGAGCLSSGFGQRSGRLHKGIDIHHPRPTPVFAGGAGVVKELTYRDDYGNMLVIEHPNGVFTRYAHLESFSRGLAEGQRVSVGTEIGIMGNTASYRIPRHLHYEVLTGEWGRQAGSFALTPVDIFRQPTAR